MWFRSRFWEMIHSVENYSERFTYANTIGLEAVSNLAILLTR